MQNSPRHNCIVITLSGLESLAPSADAETPFAATLEADGAEIVAARGGEGEEFLGYFGCDGVVSCDGGSRSVWLVG